ncbi:MAG: chloride channel protein [Muribaculaceae bacterium]|nr:chloride channel protein [Muribaculaceae bacterium]
MTADFSTSPINFPHNPPAVGHTIMETSMNKSSNTTLSSENIADAPKEREWQARFNAWRKAHISDSVFLICLAVVIGLLCGVAAFVFKYLISLIAGIFLPHITDGRINWWIILPPIGGILLAGIFTRYVIHTNLAHGVGQLINDLRNKFYRLRHNISFSPIIGGSITLGMGGSAGAEGPIAYTGAAIGSNVGQLLGLPPEMLKILIGCGTSAGIAGIFSAPIGGLMFALELVKIELSVQAVVAAMAACLTSYLTIFTLHGGHSDLTFTPLDNYSFDMLPLVMLLGVFCGVYAIYYSYVAGHLDKFYKNIKNPWIRNLTGGIAIGVILLLFPSMYGVGYPILGNVINGDCTALARGSIIENLTFDSQGLMLVASGILLCKCWAVASTNSSGGVGGDFAPTLFAGGMAGFLFATFCNTYFSTDLPVGVFAYLGMAGAMSGIIEAPLMTIFITMEMTQTYRFALPVTICASVSYIIVKGFSLLAHERIPFIHHQFWFRHGHPEKTINSQP